MRKIRSRIAGLALAAVLGAAGSFAIPTPALACMGDICDGICLAWETGGKVTGKLGRTCPVR